MKIRDVLSVMVATALAVAGAGCMPPDRSAATRNLEREIAAMPGVESATARYSNDFENGAELRLDVAMSQAGDDQITAVVARINDLKNDDFKRHRQYETFLVGRGLAIEREAELNAGQIVADARVLRRIRADVPHGRIEWSRYGNHSRLETRSVTQTMEPLVSALEALGNDVGTTVYVRSDNPAAAPTWEVEVPTSMRRKDFEGLLAGLPLAAYYVHLDHESVVGLDVYVAEKDSAFRDLSAVIHAVGPTEEHPLELRWAQVKETDNQHRFVGSLRVPGCSPAEGSAAEELSVHGLSPEAVLLQRQLRKQAASC